MTEEQIKQNADEYADGVYDRILQNAYWQECRHYFIEGAHSMLDEIKKLERVAAKYKGDAQNTAAQCERLHDIIDQLRSQWISVEDRLPKE